MADLKEKRGRREGGEGGREREKGTGL